MKRLMEHPAAFAAGAAIALRLALMAAYPALFGGDSVVRLANADRILLSYQLPALQAVIHALWSLWPSQWGPRLFLVAVSGVAAAGFFRLARKLMPDEAALAAALFFGLNPFLAAYSIVPYQEMLMLAGLCWAFAWAAEGRAGLAALALAAACLTRYEAWLACPAILWPLVVGGTPGHSFGAAVWSGAARLDAVERGAHACGLVRGRQRLQPGAVVALGVFGLDYPATCVVFVAVGRPGRVAACARTAGCAIRYVALCRCFVMFFALAILLSAHGERDQPDRYVTAREAHLPIAFVCLLAGLGLRRQTGVAIACAALSIVSAQRFVKAETSAPHVALAYEAAGLLESRIAPSQTAVVLAKPVPADMLARFPRYCQRPRRRPGNAALYPRRAAGLPAHSGPNASRPGPSIVAGVLPKLARASSACTA